MLGVEEERERFLRERYNVHFEYLPHSPSWDANALDDADANLGHEHKKEQHEVEGTVTPETRREKKQNILYLPN